MLRVTEIRINHMNEPKGITGEMTLGWRIESDRGNVYQRGYQLQIGRDSAFESLIYDSGQTESEQSQNLRLNMAEFPLESVRIYHVRVRIWDNYGEKSAWCGTRFLTGLLGNDTWSAPFITAEKPEEKKDSPAFEVRKGFRVGKPVKEAWLLATAHGLYQTFINGQKAGNDELTPGWTSYGKRLLYQSYDVTDLLVQGNNLWSAQVGAGWYKGDVSYHRIHNFYGDFAAFSGELILRYEDGSRERILTDDTWEGSDSPILFADIYDGEVYDAGRQLEKRTVTTVDAGHGKILPQPGSTVRVQEILPVQRVLVTPKGETVLDFGQNASGWVHFQVNAAPGAVVELICFETLDKDGNVYTENLRTARQTIRYICRGGGTEEYHPHFTCQGFQYVWVKQYPGQVDQACFRMLVLHSDMRRTGTFSCSEPLLNRLQSNILWGLKGNSVDVPTDCPQRDERLGWTGDVQVFCNTACYLLDMHEFYRKWLCDAAADQQADGAVTHVVPDVLKPSQPDNFAGASGWGDVAVVLPWILYQETGDLAVVRQQYDSMKAWIDYVDTHFQNGTFTLGEQFGDWVALDAEEGSYHGATPAELTSMAYLAYGAGLLAKMARALGRTEDGERYAMARQRAVNCFREKYFDANGVMTVQTQTAHVLALAFGLAPEEYRGKTAEGLLTLLRRRNMHLSTGFLGTPYLMHVLSENGYTEEAYELLLKKDFPSWLYQVEQGATTVWEHWDGRKPDGTMWSPDMNSFNHYAYGSVGKWLYEVCAGLKRDEKEPGYKHFYVEPQIGGGLACAETTHLCGYGEIKAGWRTEGRKAVLEVTVPPNTTATVRLPGGRLLSITNLEAAMGPGQDNAAVRQGQAATGRGNVVVCQEQATASLGSGHYRIVYEKA